MGRVHLGITGCRISRGLDALKIVREKYPLLPFILMSGTIGEQAAIESLKAGATDYVLKQNATGCPRRLRRAVSEATERAMYCRGPQEELKRSEKQYRILFQGNPNPMWVFDLETLRPAGGERGGGAALRVYARGISAR